jgi:ribosomal protein S18 acetylase RimI-like enzyme
MQVPERLLIEKVEVESVEKLRTISIATFVDAFGSANSSENMKYYLDRSFSTQQLLGELKTVGSYFYFAKFAGRTIGYLKINIGKVQTDLREESGLEVERIYVVSDLQGKGVGGSLIDFSIAKAKEFSRDFVWLGVWDQNFTAIDFYRKKGFIQTGSHPFYLGTDLQTDLIFRRPVKIA